MGTTTSTPTASTLRDASLETLDRIYRDATVGPLPRGRFEGAVLLRVRSPHARSTAADLAVWPFERLRFGIDFGTCTWFFVHPRMRLGHFRADRGPSRWRPTETFRLSYDVSRLPIRGILYDEVKPLGDRLCLGLGGVNRGLGEGDLFFFLLEAARRVTPPSR